MIGRRRSPMAGGVTASSPPGWRLLTFADLGAQVGTATGWTASDSGDPEYPLRLVAANVDQNVAAWPITGDALAILDRGIAAPILISARRDMSTSGNKYIAAAVGTHGPLVVGAVTTAIGGGVWAGGYGTGPVGAATIAGTGSPTISGSILLGQTGAWQAMATVCDSPTVNRVATSIATSADGQSTVAAGAAGVLSSVASLANPATSVWAILARGTAGTPSGTLDLAIWIMETPPPAPWAPQP